MKKINRNYLFIVFCIVLFFIIGLSIAYSVLNTTLNITGTADVVASTWDVHFDDASIDANFLSSDDVNEYKVLPLSLWFPSQYVELISPTEIVFDVMNIDEPGDRFIIEFDVVNAGSIDAKLESIALSNLTPVQEQYINYFVKYDDGTIPKNGDVLNSGDIKTLNLIFEFDENVTADQLPKSSETFELSFLMNYVQK